MYYIKVRKGNDHTLRKKRYKTVTVTEAVPSKILIYTL